MSEDELRPIAGETPMVMLNRRVGRIPSVTIDNADAIRQAVAHLVALGHRRVAYVAGPRTSWSNRERLPRGMCFVHCWRRVRRRICHGRFVTEIRTTSHHASGSLGVRSGVPSG